MTVPRIAHKFCAKYLGAFCGIEKYDGHYGSCINVALSVPLVKGGYSPVGAQISGDYFGINTSWSLYEI